MSGDNQNQTYYDQSALQGSADNQIVVRQPQMPRRYDDEYDRSHYRPKRQFRIPAIVNSALSIMLAGAVFFGMEAVAPERLRPSTLVGTFEGRVEGAVASAVKASELRQQAAFEDYMAQLRVYADKIMSITKPLCSLMPIIIGQFMIEAKSWRKPLCKCKPNINVSACHYQLNLTLPILALAKWRRLLVEA